MMMRAEGLSIVVQNDANRLSEGEEQWLRSIANIVEARKHKVTKHRDSKLKIGKVPGMLRDVEENSDCYDPTVVSIGPYHHGKPELMLMEEHKLIMACQYVNGNLSSLQDLYELARQLVKYARECYTDQSSVSKLDDDQFTKMMLLDGCFILQFIYCTACNKRHELEMKNNMITLVERDILLLENQIPFKVLEKLSSKFGDDNRKKKIFSDFVARICGVPPLSDNVCTRAINKLVCKCLRENQPRRMRSERGSITGFKDEPAHLLDLIRTHLFDKSVLTKPLEIVSDCFFFRSVKELKAAGIHFRRSDTNRFTDVEFKSGFLGGILKLPPIIIDEFTKLMLLNMVAYEALPDSPDDFGVSSYIGLLYSLIDDDEDVNELRSKGILLNYLATDQQVVDLFKEIAENLVPHPNAYADVKDEIERHYKSKLRICVGYFRRHFTIPDWTVIAFVGAVLALFLSATQTYFTVYPR